MQIIWLTETSAFPADATTSSVRHSVPSAVASELRASSYARCKPHDGTNKTGTSLGHEERERDGSSAGEERWPISRYSAHMPRPSIRRSCIASLHRRCTGRARARAILLPARGNPPRRQFGIAAAVLPSSTEEIVNSGQFPNGCVSARLRHRQTSLFTRSTVSEKRETSFVRSFVRCGCVAKFSEKSRKTLPRRLLSKKTSRRVEPANFRTGDEEGGGDEEFTHLRIRSKV